MAAFTKGCERMVIYELHFRTGSRSDRAEVKLRTRVFQKPLALMKDTVNYSFILFMGSDASCHYGSGSFH